MKIGDIAPADEVRESMKRGETFYAEYDLFENGLVGPNCQILELGDPMDLSTYDSIGIEFRVVGSDERPGGGEATFVTKGGPATPARISAMITPAMAELCFDSEAGALQQGWFYIEATRTGSEKAVLCGTVDVQDTAAGRT